MCICLWSTLAAAVEVPWSKTAGMDPASAWAVVYQEALPAVESRREAATRQAESRTSFFEGETPFEEAFPELVGASFSDRDVVSARLAALDARGTIRAQERVVRVPDLGNTGRERRLQDAWKQVLDAEDAADALAKRLWLGVRAHLAIEVHRRAWLQRYLGEVEAERVVAREQLSVKGADEARWLARIGELDVAVQRLHQLEAAARRAALVESVIPPDLSIESALLASGRTDDVAWWAALRVRLLGNFGDLEIFEIEQSWLEGSDAARRHARLSMLQQLMTAAPSTVIDLVEEERLTQGRSALVAGVARAQAWAAVVDQTRWAASRQQQAADDLAIAELRLALTDVVLAGAEENRLASATQAHVARQDLQRAAAEADALRAAARDDAERAAADIADAVVQAKQRGAEAWDAVSALETASTTQFTGDQTRLDAWKMEIREIRGRNVLDPARPDPDEVYADLRLGLTRLREQALTSRGVLLKREQIVAEVGRTGIDERNRIAGSRAVVMAFDTPEAKQHALASLADWERAIQREEEAAHKSMSLAGVQLDQALYHLRLVKQLKRGLSSYVSWAEIQADRGQLLLDISAELSLLGPQVTSTARERVASLVALPRSLLNFNFLTSLVFGSLWLFLLAAVWLGLRRRVDVAADWVNRVLEVHPAGHGGKQLHSTSTRVCRASLDLFFGWVLLDGASGVAPELGILLEIYLQIALYRWILGVFDWVIVPYPKRRPAYVVVGVKVHELVRSTLRIAVTWLIARRFTIDFLVELFTADALAELANLAFLLVGLLLLFRVLSRWEPELRQRVARIRHAGRLVRLLARGPATRWTVPLYAVGSGAVVGAVTAWDMLLGKAGEVESVGWLFNALHRYRLDPSAVPDQPLTEPLLNRLTSTEVGEVTVERTAARERVRSVVNNWREKQHKGVLLVTGDQGSGKRTFVDALVPSLMLDGLVCRRASLDHRLVGEEAALAWLCEVAGLPHAVADSSDAVAALCDLPPRVFVLEDLHNAFLREVNGFEAMRGLLLVLNATSAHHFWLLTMHQPSWTYLKRLGTLLDTGLIEEVVPLPALTGDELKDLVTRRAEKVGIELDFSRLEAVGPFGSDPAVEQERSVEGFFRLLAEASQGIPSVAVRMWHQCLSPDEDPDRVRVHMDPCLAGGTLSDLMEDELFVLTALRLQNQLTIDEIVAATNIPMERIRSTLQRLRHRDLLHESGGKVTVTSVMTPTVTRTLRRRHFLQWAV